MPIMNMLGKTGHPLFAKNLIFFLLFLGNFKTDIKNKLKK
jgi:hypothetical protein